MKVTSKKSISFPKLEWAISAGETKEMPPDKEAQEQILAQPDIEPAEGRRERSKKEPQEGSEE